MIKCEASMTLNLVVYAIFLVGTVTSLKLENCGAPEEGFINITVRNCEDKYSDICTLREGKILAFSLWYKPHQDVYAGYIQISALTTSTNIFPFYPLYLADLFKSTGHRIPHEGGHVYTLYPDLDLGTLSSEFFETPVRIMIRIQGDKDDRYTICTEFKVMKKWR